MGGGGGLWAKHHYSSPMTSPRTPSGSIDAAFQDLQYPHLVAAPNSSGAKRGSHAFSDLALYGGGGGLCAKDHYSSPMKSPRTPAGPIDAAFQALQYPRLVAAPNSSGAKRGSPPKTHFRTLGGGGEGLWAQDHDSNFQSIASTEALPALEYIHNAHLYRKENGFYRIFRMNHNAFSDLALYGGGGRPWCERPVLLTHEEPADACRTNRRSVPSSTECFMFKTYYLLEPLTS